MVTAVCVQSTDVTFDTWLGFLSTGDEAAKGNYALSDMKIALEWTKQNIDKYGGDGKKISIFGESAGGAAVSALMLDSKVRGQSQNFPLMISEKFWTRFYRVSEGSGRHERQHYGALGQSYKPEVICGCAGYIYWMSE